MKKVPSQLIKDQESGKSIIEQFPKPKITQYLNIGDHSIYPDAQVSVDEPLFQPVPHVIQFTNYEPLQIKEHILKLRNKDKVARSVKIIPPDSKLFQVIPCKKVKPSTKTSGGAAEVDVMSSRVAPGMEVSYIVRFSPEAKIDYSYDLTVVTEREKFILPIRAVGCRALLDFPDTLDFGPVPVKHTQEKPVMIRNIGEKTTKWHLKVPNGFKVNKDEGILEVGQSEQLVFEFTPQESRSYRDQLVLLYDKYDAVVPILGEGHNDNVYLSKAHIHMEPTSISLFSNQYYKIVNKSTVPVEFSWRAFATEREEQEKKARLNNQLSQEEAEERSAIEDSTTTLEDSAGETGSLNSDDSYDEDELRRKQERTHQKAVSTLSRKYQGIKKAVEEDPMLFQDEIFQIEPLNGKIWPNTEITCCVTFRPQGPYHYSCTAFCNVTCSEERLALNMTGQGKGPQAQLSITEMDIGDIFVNYQNEFDVGIENTGEIDCHWKLVPYETPFGSKFHFSKTEGILGVKEKSRDLVRVTFKSDILGEFSETFRIAMEGSAEMLSLTFKGHVVAPTFKFSEEIIDFGRVSYKFPVHKTVHLTNTSDVEINYVVRVPGDGRSMQNEFNITNDRGRLEKNREAQITIEFIPCFPQQYDMVLVVDLEGVGQDMLAVPIKAECLVPKVRVLPTDFLEYEQCFLRHPKSRRIEIINDDTLKAKYEIVAQDEQSKRIAIYSADQESGVINPKSSQVVNITLKTEILSSIRIPLYIKVEGYHIPFMITILATSIGPIVSVNKTEIEYGNVDVLKDYIEKLVVKNESKIPAEYTAFTKNKESVWKVIQRHGVLNPDEEKEIEVVCNADEVQKFTDTLHIIINNGDDLEVALRAKGVGSTLYCKDNLNTIDFGTEYTFSNVTKEFFLENRGRKQMKIQWVRNMKMERKASAAPTGKDATKKPASDKPSDKASINEGGSTQGGPAEGAEEVKAVYTIVPDTIVLNPKMGIMIQVRANSSLMGKIIENWLCNVTSGGERKPKVAYNAAIQGDFITPQLNFSEAKLFFKYLWEKGVPSMPISKTLEISNTGPLSTSMNLLIDPPFSCATEKLTLLPATSDQILIKFDPGMKQDRLSDNIGGKLSISHIGHPQKDLVVLQGEVCFPNLNIIPPNIDFGCILNDTSKKKYITLTNISEMPVNYEWSFLEEELMSPIKENETAKKKKNKALPINEVYDILPVSGLLQPGQTETVEFTFYAGHGLLYNGVAVCSVDGGPDYEVPIVGESSFVSYKLSTQELDYGEIPYNEQSSKEFFIENIGKVPFQFNINNSTVSRPGLVDCHPMSGKVAAGEKYKVIVKFFPGIPANIDEMFLVECAHFPAQRFKVRAVGTYPGCLLSFPRAEDEEFHQMFQEVKKALKSGGIREYTAVFNPSEAIKQMAPLPKAIEKDKSLVKEPFIMEVEAEVDRRILCEKILSQIEAATQKQMYATSPQFGQSNTINASLNTTLGGAVAPVEGGALKTPKGGISKKPLAPASKTATAGFDKNAAAATDDKTSTLGGQPTGGATLNIGGTLVSLDNITIANYSCDFGNVVVGATKKKSFRFTNVGKLAINFAFDKKILANYGIAIEPDKVQKLAPNQSVLFNVVYVTRKNAKFGKVKNIVPIDVKYGPSYSIEFVANLTIPELTMSSDSLDFQKVCVNTRKTIKVRFENHKEVPCDWSYFYKADVSASKEGKEAGERFMVNPQSGTLLPGQKQTVDIMFTPNLDKAFLQKINFKCKDNPKIFILNAKGQGIFFQVDFVPDAAKLGPVLPYSTSAITCIEMRNPMEIPVELYSLDFDKQYLEEEEILKRLDQFQLPPVQNPPTTPAQAPPVIEPLFMSLRVPGAQFWPSLRQQDEKKQRMDELRKKLKTLEDDLTLLAKLEAEQEKTPLPEGHADKKATLIEQKAHVETQIGDQDQETAEVKMPPAVKDKDKLNLVLIGPQKAGKTSVANYLAQEHQRCVVRLDQLFDFCVKRNLPVGEKAQKYLESRHEELTKALEEQEKAKKAKGKKPPPKGQEEPEINQAEFKYLSKDLVIEMLQQRVREEDCNAGVIFDCLESPQWPNLKFAMESICEALPTQNIQVLLFQFSKEPLEVVAPVVAAEGEEAVVEDIKPKEFTKEEQEAYAKLAEEINNNFAEILLRQMNATEEEAQQEEQPVVEGGAEEAKEAVEEQQQPENAEAPPAKLIYGKRILIDLTIASTIKKICEQSKKAVPEPIWPDPDKEPLPAPLTHSILRPAANRKERPQVTLFSVWTPSKDAPVEGEEANAFPEMSSNVTRWILQPKESKKIYVKFFSKNIGNFDQILQFEIVGAYKPNNLTLNAVCEFPTVNSNFRNVFMAQKKSRPTQAPESYLSKCYVVSESVFDFGPLLIGKDSEKRNTDELVKKMNSSVFQISNNGKYDLNATFTLKSSLPLEEGGTGEKSPFIIEPETMDLKIDETKHLTVWSFPDQAKPFKDEVICLLKDNPNPVLFPVQCLGAKPIVEVDQDVVEFDRLLLEKKLTKTLTLKNVCSIPIKWKLTGIEGLPEEFLVSKTSGTIKPCKEELVEIVFTAKKEQKFNPKLVLEVEDTEGYSVKQEPKTIELRAEAFKISLDIKFSHEQILDFEAVRVGEPKENKLVLKNIGMYSVKYNFTMKKKHTREIFTVDPMEGDLQPGEEKSITVKFQSSKELKLKTSKNESDIILNIFEGKSQEKHTQIPINVNVNAVFSKYSITPLKNINFGPMTYGEQVTRTFEVRNEGLFEFKYALCDHKDEEAKKRIKEERAKEIEERVKGAEEKKEEVKDPKKKAEPAKAPPKKPDAKGGAQAPPEGGQLEVSQYTVSPATGAIPPGSAAVINVTFKAKGMQFYESTIAIDIANRDPADNADGIPFELNAESSVPGINTDDLDQIFEEQTVIPSLDPSLNTQTIIQSSIFATQERLFWFGTLIASKTTEGKERFKIMNPNKVPCTVKFAVKARSQSKSEGFAFDVKPDVLTIEPHKHKYVTVGFYPVNMMTYGGIFEATVDNGDPTSKQGKLVFDLRGEGTLPTLQIEKPKEQEADGTPILRFRKTRIGKDTIMQIVLKNEGSIAATARFDVIKNDCFSFLGNLTHTITPKSYQAFDIALTPKAAQVEKIYLTFNTQHNPFEQHKVLLIGEGYQENVTFEGLPEGLEDELLIGDCIVNKAKSATFQIVNNGDKTVRFRWNQGDKDEFKFFPSSGHLQAKTSKQVKVIFKSQKTVKYDKIDLLCETFLCDQKPDPETGAKYRDWDDTMKTVRMVRPSEHKKIMKQREEEERKRKEEAEAAALAAAAKGKAPAKAPAKPAAKEDSKVDEIVIDMSEEPSVELVDTIAEPEYNKVEGTDKSVPMKTTLLCDQVKYECASKIIEFKPTLMYASRSYKFAIKNTSLITMNYNFKIVNAETGILDAGAYTVIPKKGSIAPGCDDTFIVKFSPTEVEHDFSRILSANIENLSPEMKPLILEVNGIAERPIVHFEVPPSNYKERKEKDMVAIDNKFKIIEFDSLGTNIKNTKRFMAVNPTGQGYEFEWEEMPDEHKKLKPMFKCITHKGVILSGKKFEMIFEYTPDNVGEHESYWMFKVPSEKIVQHFMVVGRVVEPNVLFETGKIKFGPLLLEGKNREVVNIINQEQIPFSFNFSKESVKGSTEYGDSLKVNPMSGVVPPGSQVPIEILFYPKYELTYNYNLTCNVKRKARPLVLNVKGEGYKIHHSVFADISRQPVTSADAFKFEYGDFFINEKKTKVVTLTNNGEFNFDFVWKRQVNKYITITPETGTVQKGSEATFEITYLPIAEHHLKSYKVSLNIVSGPKYDFLLSGNARKPGVKLSFQTFDFGPCFVMRQPMPKRAILEIVNYDNSAISVEIPNFEKKPYIDVQLAPGQVLLPSTKENPIKLEVPIIFTPRVIKKYAETIKFDFNGLYTIDVTVAGEGIPMQLELVDPDQAVVDFGIVTVGGDITKTVQLVNKSKQPVTFSLAPSNAEQFKKCCLAITPDKEVTLKPREVVPIEVRYAPKHRMPNYDLDVQLIIKDNESRSLLQVQGTSHGIELKLMDAVVAFGSVVRNSRLTKILQLSNFGDVKAAYKWDNKAYSKFFTITPETGYVNPNSTLDLEVTFHPSIADSDIRYNQVKCEIKGGDPLFVTLMGKSVEQDPSTTQTLNFQTVVRKPTKQVVAIQNTEDKEWVINPTISTAADVCAGFFSGKQTLVVPPKQTAQYEIHYAPKTMTKKNAADQFEAHIGSLFFPLPNGTALLYNLNAVATEPEAEALPVESVVAKKARFIIIPVKNWLKTDQRFKVSWVVEGDKDQTTFVKGANMLDMAGESTKDFKLNFLAYKVGSYKVKLTFLNEASGEYLSFVLSVNATEPDLLETIELASPIRESITRIITIENPTDTEVVIQRSQFTFTSDYVEVGPDVLKVPPKAERGFEVMYRPLIISEQEVDLILKNPVLGDFKYKLLLKGLPATSQRSLAFRCALGNDLVQAFKFTHFLKKPTAYTIKVERLDQPGQICDFKSEVPQVQAQAADSAKGMEVVVNVKYEPFTIGETRAILKLTSPEGMEYTCLLLGKATAPLPQGPVKCPPGAKPAGIDFKNPLNEKCEFVVTFDNPNFSLASKLPGPIDPGKVVNLQIKYDAKADLPTTGRMVVSTKGLPPWIFYLQGE